MTELVDPSMKSPRDPSAHHVGLLAVAALLMLTTAMVSGQGMVRILMVFASGLLSMASLAVLIGNYRARNERKKSLSLLAAVYDAAEHQTILTDPFGSVLHANLAAINGGWAETKNVFDGLSGQALDGEKKCKDLIAKCAQDGSANLEISLRDSTLRIEVISLNARLLVWTLENSSPAAEAIQNHSSARIPMLTIGRSGTILFMNPAARRLLGERKKTLADVFGEDVDKIREANVVHTSHGEQRCLVAEYDVTAGRREIYILPTSVPTMRDGAVQFDEIPVALLKMDQEGRILSANRAARLIIDLDIGTDTVMGELMEGLGRSIRDWLVEVADGKIGNHSEFLRLKRQDKEVIVQVSLNRVVEGDQNSLIAVLSDATELKSLEAQFVQSQKMQAIGQLAGGVAHDFNNLLTAISGHCDLLLLRHDQGDSDYADLIQINQNANRAAALVGQLLAFSRKQNLRPEVLDLRNTLADLTHLLNRLVGEKVSLTLNNDPVLPSIRADKRQLEQVLMNLVVNARDAMPDGGEIRVSTEGVEMTEPLERDRVVVPTGRYVSVKVADDGMGIAPDKLQKVFEPFFTTKRTGEGTGLGLSTAYGIVKQSGGYIFVDSTQGVGTTFWLMFPAHGLSEAMVVTPVADGRPVLPAVEHSGVVLLVEDEAPVRSFATRALKMRGFTVLEACSGEEAIELLEAENPKIDVFVSDVIMPGMDGPSWVRQAREQYPDVPVIFVSGYAEDSFSDEQARIENSSFLPKPFSLGDLTEAVQSRIMAS